MNDQAKSRDELIQEIMELRKEHESLKVSYQDDTIISKKDEAELLLYGEIIRNMEEGFLLIHAADGIIVFANPKFERMFGYGSMELVGKHVSHLNAPTEKSPEETATEIIRSLNVKGSWQGVVQNIKKDGSVFWGQANVSTFDHPQHGRVWISIHHEITGQKITEMLLKESEETFRSIFENSSSAMAIIEPDTTISMVNEEYCKLSNFTRQEIIGTSWTQQITQEDRERLKEYNRRRLINSKDAPEKYEFTFYHKNGGIRHALMSVALLSNRKIVASVADITELKKSEVALRESEEKHRVLLNGSSYGILAIDVETHRFLFSNPAISKLFGYTDKELQRLSIEDLVPRESLDLVMSEFASQMRGEKSVSFAQACIRKDGTVFYADIAGAPIMLNGRKCSVGFFIDVTSRQQAKESLMESESNLNQAQEIAMMGSWEFDLITNKVNWSKNCFRLYGLEPYEFEPSFEYFKSRVHPDDLHIIDESFENISKFKKNYIIEVRISFPDGNDRWAQINLSPVVKEDELVALKGIQIDINDRKTAEERIRINEASIKVKNAQLIEAQRIAHVGSWTHHLDNPMPTWSDEMFVIFGIDPKNGVPKFPEFRQLVNADQRPDLDVALKAIMTTGQAYSLELQVNLPDGNERIIHLQCEAFLGSDGLPFFTLGTAQDITDRKQFEMELLNARKKAEESDRLKSAFLANMSHEIRTPMNGILGFAQLLKEPNLTGKEQQEYIRIIEKSGKRMLNIIHDIVDISKIESGQVEVSISETNINEQIEYICAFFTPEAEKKGLQLFYKTILPAKEAIITTDREKIHSILSNLVKNAVKYTKEGSIEIGYEKKGRYLEFFIKDSGIGIPKERQVAIFERFIQADISNKHAYDGAGLGLAITRGYVEMLGGEIWVESREGSGSTFFFTIPYIAEPNEKAVIEETTPVEGAIYQINNLKILITEDDEISGEFISSVIDKYCRVILYAVTGVETIETCRNNPDIDFILMDIRMPEMNGYEATRQIRQFNKDVIIIAQTAYGLSGDREKALKAGCNDYISKPIDRDMLLGLINKHFKPNSDLIA